MNFAVVVFPGSNSDYDAFHAASAVVGERASLVWHKDTSAGRRGCGDPAGRLRPRRLPAHRRDRPLLADHGQRRDLRRRGAARCSASATASRCCSRRACCRGRWSATAASSSCRASCRSRGRADRHAVHQVVRRGPGAPAADRARRGQLLRRRRPGGRPRSQSPGGLPLRRRRRARPPTTATPTARCTTSPGSATTPATSSG